MAKTPSSSADLDDARTASHLDGALTIDGFGRWAKLGRTSVYAEIAKGKLQARKVGRRTIITAQEARRWLAALPRVKSR